MTLIATAPGTFTLINTFDVEPGKQQAVIDLLIDVTERFTQHQPGFLSATVHRGVTGQEVANYVQWRSHEDFEAIFQTPEMRQHVEELRRLVKALRPLVYQLAYTRSANNHA